MTTWIRWLVCAVVHCGCCLPKDRPFRTTAVYHAPNSGYELHIVGHGIIKANADVADLPHGVVTILPAEGKPQRKIILTVDGYDMVEAKIAGEEPTPLVWNFRTRAPNLSDVLHRAGYSDLDADEVEESTQVIEGATAGPKGTLMPGQTKFLDVLTIEFE